MYIGINSNIAPFRHSHYPVELDVDLEGTQKQEHTESDLDVLVVPMSTRAPATHTNTGCRREDGDELGTGVRDHDDVVSANNSVIQSVLKTLLSLDVLSVKTEVPCQLGIDLILY